MHSIIKNHLSKVLALTTMVSSFAILPGAKASGTEPENIPQLHSIIKNHLSKVLALTTMVSSFAILPVAKASGTEPENIPQLQNGRSETQVITDEMINQAIAELNERLGGTDVVRCSPAFLSNRPVAYKILQKLISCFALIPKYCGDVAAKIQKKFTHPGKKLYLKSLSEASDTLVLSCYKCRDVNASITIGDTPTPNVPSEDITPNAITMFFNWTKERDKRRYYDVDSITCCAYDSFIQIVTNTCSRFACGYYEPSRIVYKPVEPISKEEPKSILRPPSSLSSDGASSEHVRQTVWYRYRVPAVSRSSNMNNIFGLNSNGISCSFYTTERDLEKVKEKLRKRFCKLHKMESFTQEEYNIAKTKRGVKFNDGGQGQGIHSYTFEDVSRAIERIRRREVPVRIYNCGDHESPKEWCCIIYSGRVKAETIVYLPNRSHFDSYESWQDFLLKVSTFDGMIKHTKELISTPPEISTVKLIEGRTCSSCELLDNDLECTGISMNIEWLE